MSKKGYIMKTSDFNTTTLKDFRHRKGLTQKMVASIIVISESHYSNIENSNRGLSYKIAKRLAACYSTTPDTIFKTFESDYYLNNKRGT